LECFAKIATKKKNAELAALIWGACENWREHQEIPLPAVEREEYQAHLE